MKDTVRGLVTVKEAADVLHCSAAAIRKWQAQGVLKRVKLGRAVRVRWSDLEKAIAEGLPEARSQYTSAS